MAKIGEIVFCISPQLNILKMQGGVNKLSGEARGKSCLNNMQAQESMIHSRNCMRFHMNGLTRQYRTPYTMFKNLDFI